MKTAQTKKIEINTVLELSGQDILEKFKVPKNARNATIVFHVPSGGDYSGMDLDINDDETIIRISYQNDIELPE